VRQVFGPASLTVDRQAVQDRQGKRRRLARTGLGATKQIAALEEIWDRLRLDWRRRGVALGAERALDRLDQPEAGECSQVVVSFGMAMRRYDTDAGRFRPSRARPRQPLTSW
jgi:hypothetical protein